MSFYKKTETNVMLIVSVSGGTRIRVYCDTSTCPSLCIDTVVLIDHTTVGSPPLITGMNVVVILGF